MEDAEGEMLKRRAENIKRNADIMRALGECPPLHQYSLASPTTDEYAAYSPAGHIVCPLWRRLMIFTLASE